MDKITQFQGKFRFLSNFWATEFVYDSIVWPSSEHCYQAMKTLDRNSRLMMSKVKSPAHVKKMGRLLVVREDWDAVKIDTMREIVHQKFLQNPHLKQLLVETGDTQLEEGNWWNDKFWGVSPAGSDKGQNNLGKILMALREQFKNEPQKPKNKTTGK